MKTRLQREQVREFKGRRNKERVRRNGQIVVDHRKRVADLNIVRPTLQY